MLNKNTVDTTGQKCHNCRPHVAFAALPYQPTMARPVGSFRCIPLQVAVLIVLSLLKIACAEQETAAETPETPSYGVDVSFPMQHAQVTDMERPFGDSVMPFYNKFLQGCRKFYEEKSERCEESELSRLNLNSRQPPVMQNYTSAGYAKVQLPSQIMKQLQDFWENNEGEEKIEQWPAGNTYVNHWEAPTYMLPLGNQKLKGGGNELTKGLLDAVQPTLEAWTGQSLVFTSLYGIRVYKEGAVLSPHIDRLPLVTSAIINVAQDVEEPWVLEVIGHDGKATNVTLEPGDMVLYESHSVIHGKQSTCIRQLPFCKCTRPANTIVVEMRFKQDDLFPYEVNSMPMSFCTLNHTVTRNVTTKTRVAMRLQGRWQRTGM